MKSFEFIPAIEHFHAEESRVRVVAACGVLKITSHKTVELFASHLHRIQEIFYIINILSQLTCKIYFMSSVINKLLRPFIF